MPDREKEIIRCKDCIYRPTAVEGKHGIDYVFPYEGKCPCQCDDDWYSWRPNDDWFCANGERAVKHNAQPTAGGWISVEDGLPENEDNVLVCLSGVIPRIGRHTNNGEWEDGEWLVPAAGSPLNAFKSTGDMVTHWMPLPEAPRER